MGKYDKRFVRHTSTIIMVLSFLIKCILTLLFSSVLYYLWLIVTNYRVAWFSMSQKGLWLPLFPFVGNAYLAVFTGLRVNMLSSLLWGERVAGMPLNFWYGKHYHYVINSAEKARIVLNHPKCQDKAALYNNLRYIFKNSILLSPEEQWKGRRRYLRSAYNTNMINTFIPTFYQQSCALIDLIKKKKPEDDHYKFFNTHAFMNFFLTSIGWLAEDVKDSDVKEFGHLVDKTQDEFVKLFVTPSIPISIWIRSPLGTKLYIFRKQMMQVLNNIIKKKIAQMAKHSEYVANTTELPLVELLLNDGYDSLEKQTEIFHEFTLFAAAATDTTGHSLTFVFTLLGMFPDIQQKLYEEVMSVVEDKEIDNQMLSKLVYTEAVLNEALRIFPVIPLLGRYCHKDIELGDKTVPAGANIVLSIFHIHRNPEYWDNPLEFDPSRFLPENCGKIKPGSFLPFSIGPRNCIGQRMATTLIKMTIATVVRHFKISSKHKSIKEFKLSSCISMKTRYHLDLHFTPRSQNGH
uniref:Cytochrome P450 monooxygenase CYP410D4 n=1 Tax=Euwallacea interjectus TaxID=321055 RepID=A0A9Y1YYE3_9CUCU|nr:cytochrome P450 monooxygenase CYP410D4 [Euwallacea interjectus]